MSAVCGVLVGVLLWLLPGQVERGWLGPFLLCACVPALIFGSWLPPLTAVRRLLSVPSPPVRLDSISHKGRAWDLLPLLVHWVLRRCFAPLMASEGASIALEACAVDVGGVKWAVLAGGQGEGAGLWGLSCFQ